MKNGNQIAYADQDFPNFDVLLTVHLSIILEINQLDAIFFFFFSFFFTMQVHSITFHKTSILMCQYFVRWDDSNEFDIHSCVAVNLTYAVLELRLLKK